MNGTGEGKGEVRGGKGGNLKPFEHEHTIRMEIMVKSNFRTLTDISANLGPTFHQN